MVARLLPALKTAAAYMPMFLHFDSGRSFRIEESDVAKLALRSAEIMQDVFNRMKMAGAILYV